MFASHLGKLESTNVNSLYLSLGPSMKSLTLNIPEEYKSLGSRLQSMFGNQNLMNKMILASASSIVFMVRVDCSKVNIEGNKQKIEKNPMNLRFSGDWKVFKTRCVSNH